MELATRKKLVMFSKMLTDAVEKVLARGEQAMIFLNRRGFSTYINCKKCGLLLKCKSCDSVMVYHYETKNTMVQLAEKYKNKNVVWLAINSTNHTTPQANIEFSQKNKLPFPILDDRSGKVGRAYDAKTTPNIFIINPRGRIVYDGAIDDSPLGNKKEGVVNYVDNVLAELTAGKTVSPKNTKPYGCTVKYATN